MVMQTQLADKRRNRPHATFGSLFSNVMSDKRATGMNHHHAALLAAQAMAAGARSSKANRISAAAARHSAVAAGGLPRRNSTSDAANSTRPLALPSAPAEGQSPPSGVARVVPKVSPVSRLTRPAARSFSSIVASLRSLNGQMTELRHRQTALEAKVLRVLADVRGPRFAAKRAPKKQAAPPRHASPASAVVQAPPTRTRQSDTEIWTPPPQEKLWQSPRLTTQDRE